MRNLHIRYILFLFLLLSSGCRKTIEPPFPGKTVDFKACVQEGVTSTFEIVSINLQGFPKTGFLTILAVRDLINTVNPDVVALQEVIKESDFNRLLEELPGWDGRFNPEKNDEWNLAYIFKKSEITIDDSKTKIFYENESYAFPRAPFEIYLKHKTLNISAYIINLHLKCCSGYENEDRRRNAAEKLDNYIKSYHPDDPVIIVGDFNDSITGDNPEDNVFHIFVSAPSEYIFTDMHIADGSLLWWSYPSWPSHIDHILVTNELFTNVDTTLVLKTEPCYPDYFENISDHRPVELILK